VHSARRCGALRDSSLTRDATAARRTKILATDGTPIASNPVGAQDTGHATCIADARHIAIEVGGFAAVVDRSLSDQPLATPAANGGLEGRHGICYDARNRFSWYVSQRRAARRGFTNTFMPMLPPSPTAAELAIIRSVLYASLFDYPVTLAELRRTLIESVQSEAEILRTYRSSAIVHELVDCREGFFFPRGCDTFVGERRRREARSRVFLEQNRTLLNVISAVPFVRLMALSGSVAHLNADRDADLDLFIVTKGRRVWSVTVAVLVLAKLMRRRRIVCANFVVADSRLALDPQDLYTASQLIHLRPLCGEAVFRQLLAANPFVARLYPNFACDEPDAFPFRRGVGFDRLKAGLELLCELPSRLVEAACRRAYRWYLEQRRSSWHSPEAVQLRPDCLKLHTQSHRKSVLERFDSVVAQALARAPDAAGVVPTTVCQTAPLV
jgi:hypothetical protein